MRLAASSKVATTAKSQILFEIVNKFLESGNEEVTGHVPSLGEPAGD
jgi:hypothetical protein